MRPGPGESTLIKCLTGAVQPSAGGVRLDGQPLPLGRPDEIIRGSSCLYLSAFEPGSDDVGDGQYLHGPPAHAVGLVDRRRQRRETVDLLARYGIDLHPDAIVGSLPTVKQKEVEIAKALALEARVLLMDEPTGWLATSDVQRLYDTIRLLRARGVGILYISHIMDEIFAVCDSLTILRDGQVVAESDVGRITRTEVVAAMVGDRLAQESLDAMSGHRKALSIRPGQAVGARADPSPGVFRYQL